MKVIAENALSTDEVAIERTRVSFSNRNTSGN
jgi:hypothetical protein